MNFISRHLFVLCLQLALLCAPGFAWGPAGHRVVSVVAERYLTQETHRAVVELLDGESIAQASTWADEIKSDRKWDFASPWHYVNLDDDESYATAPKNPAGDVIEAITRLRAVLQDRNQPRKKRAEALRFLIHLVADIHQPLHVGRRSDRGGNDVKVRWFGRETNIHAVWDSDIINHWELSYTELATFLKMPTAAERAQWQKDGVQKWADESMAYRARIYEIGDGRLGYEYGYVHGPFLKQRLVQAGVRLAGLLNAAFSR
ncbi:MAG: S1/P1 nuclease [Bryobacterales bacterium]|nr:S1/P1 nuclease [Bryobacterales bacterium]